MRGDAIAMGLAGVLFGLIVGWIVGAQASQSGVVATRPTAQAAQAAEPAAAPATQSRALDTAQVARLTEKSNANPSDKASRAELGNLFFDAEQYPEAIKWYESAHQIDPRDVDISTDLGVSYYYTNQADKALTQFERSLAIDAKHTKTLLNQGIVRAFGKQDLKGAEQSWEQVLTIAPDSAEAKAAKQALDTLRSAHNASAGAPAPAAPTP